MDAAIAEILKRDGFANPVRVFDRAECARVLGAMAAERRKPKVWEKGCAVSGRSYYDAATDPRILALVTSVLGEDVVLWGASLVVKRPGQVHHFHTDVETADPEGGFVSIWLGLENTERSSGLKFVRASHKYGISAQEANHRQGVAREESTDATILRAAREFDAAADIIQPEVSDGEAVAFDGRIWHGSHNEVTSTRTALLLQYAAADRPVFMPAQYGWPFRMRTDERPPVLLVAGTAPIGVNRVAVAPGAAGGAVVNAAYELTAPVQASEVAFASLPHFRGTTPRLDMMECHSSVLMPGASPHALHTHPEEEILVVMKGEAELMTADDISGTNLRHTSMRPGDFGYYPAFQPHTLRNVSSAPVTYTMFKWRNDAGRPSPAERLALVKASERLAAEPEAGRKVGGRVLEAASKWLERVHCHVSVVAPGDGYDAHADTYDVAIVLLAGAIETLERTVCAPAVLYHPAGELHGLRVVGAGAARYLAFEFDGERRNRLWTRARQRLGRLRRSVRHGVAMLLERRNG